MHDTTFVLTGTDSFLNFPAALAAAAHYEIKPKEKETRGVKLSAKAASDILVPV